jgi:hypothetical protein
MLLEKIKKSRQSVVNIDGHAYTIRRPTPMDAMEWLGNVNTAETQRWFEQHFNLKSPTWRKAAWYAVLHFVDGWDLTELDIYSGGDAKPAAFTLDVFEEYLRDHPSTLNRLAVEIFSLWLAHLQQLESDEKKPPSGSTAEPLPSNPAA